MIPQSNGYLDFELPSHWKQADAFQLTATDPHGREIYTWSWPITKPKDWVQKTVTSTEVQDDNNVRETTDQFILASDDVEVQINKNSGFISGITKNGNIISLRDGPMIVGGETELIDISAEKGVVKAMFSGEDFDVAYSLRNDGWLEIDYSYKPHGSKPYFGVTFSYPEEQVNGIRWAGNGPYRV